MGAERAGRSLMLFAPLLAAGLCVGTVRLFAWPLLWDTESLESVWLGELLPVWLPICVVGVAGAAFGTRTAPKGGQASAAMFSLIPIWALVLGCVALWIEQASIVDTNCGPASRETELVGEIGELHGTFVLAFAWSAAMSLCSALSTLAARRRQETVAALSLLLSALSFTAATFNAGAVRLALRAGHFVDAALTQKTTEQASVLGGLAALLMVGAVAVGFVSHLGLLSSPPRVLLIGALTVVPLTCWAFALRCTEPVVELMKERLPRTLLIDGLRPMVEKPHQLHGWSDESFLVDHLDYFAPSSDERWVFHLEVAEEVTAPRLRRVLRALQARRVVEVELQGTASGMTPLPLDAIERRVAFSPSATRLRLRGEERCVTCVAKVSLEKDGLRVVHPDGATEVWARELIAPDTIVEQFPGVEWDGAWIGNQALVDASLIALSHGRVLVLKVR